MAPQLQLSTYAQEFSSPVQVKTIRNRPISDHRRNNPHPRPDFLLPRKPQTGYGHRPMFQTIVSPKNPPLFPPVRHMSVQFPDDKAPQTRFVLNSSHTAAAHTLPSSGLLPKPQVMPGENMRHRQSQSSDNMQRKLSVSIPPLRPFNPQHTSSRPNSKLSLDSSGGYSCFHVVKPYKAGYYIIHPEFMSEWRH